MENDKLQRVTKALGVSKEAIENFSEEYIFNNILNNYEGSTINTSPIINHQCSFNSLDKVVELYESLVQAKKDKVPYLEKLMGK